MVNIITLSMLCATIQGGTVTILFLIFNIFTNLINVLLACYNSEAFCKICFILIRGWDDFNTLEKMQEGLQKIPLSQLKEITQSLANQAYCMAN